MLSGGSLLADWCGWSQKGLRRTQNEDCFGFVSLERGKGPRLGGGGGPEKLSSDSPSPLPVAFAIADGIGGAPAGERASQIAVDTYLRFLSEEAELLAQAPRHEKEISETLRRGLWRCRAQLREEERARPQNAGMGTTLTAAVALGPDLYVVHAGDARAQIVQDGRLRILTREHTLAGTLVEAGSLTPKAARISPWRRVLNNFLSADRSGLYADTVQVRVRPGDVLILSTDGFAGALTDEDVASILSRGGDARQLCQALSEACRHRETRDDATVVIATFRSSP